MSARARKPVATSVSRQHDDQHAQFSPVDVAQIVARAVALESAVDVAISLIASGRIKAGYTALQLAVRHPTPAPPATSRCEPAS